MAVAVWGHHVCARVAYHPEEPSLKRRCTEFRVAESGQGEAFPFCERPEALAGEEGCGHLQRGSGHPERE